jgi:hypothetical protein
LNKTAWKENAMPIFLKFQSPGGRGEIENASLKIDEVFRDLNGPNPLPIPNPGVVTLDALGDALLKLGSDFRKLEGATSSLDNFLHKHKGEISSADGSVDVAAGLHTDFLKLEQGLGGSAGDLRALGADFLKLDGAPDPETLLQGIRILNGDGHKISADMSLDGGAFLKLSDDFLGLSSGGDRPTESQLAYKEFAGELKTVAADFDVLAVDWNKLGSALAGDGGPVTNTIGSATGGADAGKIASP